MFSVNFLANQYVSDVDINAVGYNLANTVYTSFANDTVYGVNELNAITSHMMNKGVKRNYKNECAVSLNEGIVHIDSGLVFFENGATMAIDEEGIDLTVEDTEQQYIYLFFDEALNVAGARCAALPEANVSYVILGTVANGVVTQDRTFAYLNTDVKGTNEVLTLILKPSIVQLDDDASYDAVVQYRTGINVMGYAKAFCMTPEDEIYDKWSGGTDIACVMVSYDIQNNTCLAFSTYTYHANNRNRAYSFATGTLEYTYIEDGELVIGIGYKNGSGTDFDTRNLKVELYGGVEE